MVVKGKRKPVYALVQWRIRSQLSANEAAMLFGVNDSLFRRWETGERKISEPYIAGLTKVTGIPRMVLLHERGRPPEYSIVPFKRPKGGHAALVKMIKSGEIKIPEPTTETGNDDPRFLALKAVKMALGGATKLAELVGVTPQAINKWSAIPVTKCQAISDATGIPKSTLRPDFFRDNGHDAERPGPEPEPKEIEAKGDEPAKPEEPPEEEDDKIDATPPEVLAFTFAIDILGFPLKGNTTVVGDLSGIGARIVKKMQQARVHVSRSEKPDYGNFYFDAFNLVRRQ